MIQVDEFVRVDLLFIIFVSLYLLAKKTAIQCPMTQFYCNFRFIGLLS